MGHPLPRQREDGHHAELGSEVQLEARMLWDAVRRLRLDRPGSGWRRALHGQRQVLVEVRAGHPRHRSRHGRRLVGRPLQPERARPNPRRPVQVLLGGGPGAQRPLRARLQLPGADGDLPAAHRVPAHDLHGREGQVRRRPPHGAGAVRRLLGLRRHGLHVHGLGRRRRPGARAGAEPGAGKRRRGFGAGDAAGGGRSNGEQKGGGGGGRPMRRGLCLRGQDGELHRPHELLVRKQWRGHRRGRLCLCASGRYRAVRCVQGVPVRESVVPSSTGGDAGAGAGAGDNSGGAAIGALAHALATGAVAAGALAIGSLAIGAAETDGVLSIALAIEAFSLAFSLARCQGRGGGDDINAGGGDCSPATSPTDNVTCGEDDVLVRQPVSLRTEIGNLQGPHPLCRAAQQLPERPLRQRDDRRAGAVRGLQDMLAGPRHLRQPRCRRTPGPRCRGRRRRVRCPGLTTADDDGAVADNDDDEQGDG
mmetsp:Transcript_29033/g.81551  ORF Transcript_29033/g.81551 Transcript_29033/m.81551 type:complete len:478 (-) Transcript_29033:357-1790(-)